MTMATKQVEVMKTLAIKFVTFTASPAYAACTLTVRDNPVIVNSAAAAGTFTLPSIDKATDVGIPITIYMRTAGNDVVINSAGDTEEAVAITDMNLAGDSCTFIPRRTFWEVINNIA